MADTFTLDIVTPTALVFSGEVEMLTAPGSEGEFGVLAGHTEFLTTLKAGPLVYRKGGHDVVVAVSRGYAEVTPSRTTVLVASAMEGVAINAEEARKELREAEEALKHMKEDDPGRAVLMEKLELAEAMLSVVEKKTGH
jgi:F-type H+-transporting ATPase subunit epsilon